MATRGGVHTCSRVQIRGVAHKMLVGHMQCSSSRVSRSFVYGCVFPDGHVSIPPLFAGVGRVGYPQGSVLCLSWWMLAIALVNGVVVWGILPQQPYYRRTNSCVHLGNALV